MESRNCEREKDEASVVFWVSGRGFGEGWKMWVVDFKVAFHFTLVF